MTMQRQATIKPERVDPAYLPPSYHQQQLEKQQQMAPNVHTAQNPRPSVPGSLAAIKPSVVSINTKTTDENIESRPDFSSIKGAFGWTTIDEVSVPYILRQDKQFVSVRIVELKLLSKYPNSYPDDLGTHAPLTSFFITVNEAKLLNEINLQHCNGEYGKKEFSQKDLIVLLTDFCKFYELVKKTFPDAALARDSMLGNRGGWLQIKNTVMPFIKRNDGKYVPLSVVQYAAGLLTNVKVGGVLPSGRECDILNKACIAAGVEFVFSETTRLISVEEILSKCHVKIIELPSHNPLKHALYMELPTSTSVQEKAKAAKLTSNPNPQHPTKQTQPQPQPQPQPQLQPQPQSQPQSQSQLVQNPYQFQHTSQLEMMRTHLEQRIRATELNQNGGQIPHPSPYNNGLFDPTNPANLYRLQYPPNGRQQSVRPGQPPPGYPMNPTIDYMHHYYMQQQQMLTGLSSRPTPPQGPPNVVLPQPGIPLNSHRDMTNKSPGSTSSNPSPRSRPPSQSRPPSGPRVTSRPPSGSPLSPTGPIHTGQTPHRRDMAGQVYGAPEGSPTVSQSPVFSPGIVLPQHMYGSHVPVVGTSAAPHMMTGIEATAPLPAHRPSPAHQPHVSNMPGVAGQERLVTPVLAGAPGVPASRKRTHSANQEIPGLFSPTGLSVNVGVDTTSQRNKRTVPSSPPALVLMTPTPVPNTLQVATSNSSISASDSAVNLTRISKSPVEAPASAGPTIITDTTSNQPALQKVAAVSKPKVSYSKYIEHIHGAWLKNKSISCLHLDDEDRRGQFCLVEAVCKLYFNGCSVNEFLFALENVLNVPLLTCSDEEERAFISYYSLPVEVLKCNKMIKFDDLENFFPQLSYMFPDKNATDFTLGQDYELTGPPAMESEQENNNVNKDYSNGVETIAHLDSAVLETMAHVSAEKRPGDVNHLGPSPKHLKTTEGQPSINDTVIILD